MALEWRVRVQPPSDANLNTSWFRFPGVRVTYVLLILVAWILFQSFTTASLAWTFVNLGHFMITYRSFHWQKGTPFPEDQGIYRNETWWEQLDEGEQWTGSKKFLTVIPVVLYMIASHASDYRNPMLLVNTVAMLVLLIAKLPTMHKVRIFGINAS